MVIRGVAKKKQKMNADDSSAFSSGSFAFSSSGGSFAFSSSGGCFAFSSSSSGGSFAFSSAGFGFSGSFASTFEEQISRVTKPAPRSSTSSLVGEDIDWRVMGAVTPVKDQQGARTCEVFATVGAIEGMHFRYTGELLELSSQDLIDGRFNYNGLVKKSGNKYFDYVREYGIATLEDYPMKRNSGKCKETKVENRVYIDDCVHVTPGDEAKMLDALGYQPLFACMHMTDEFSEYGPGGEIYDVTTHLDHMTTHCVLIVGHTTRDGKPCWIIKNSYGERWGDGGYMYVLRDGSYNGVGGINLHVYYPV